MSWVSIILYIIMNIPQLISLVKQIIALIQNRPKAERESIRHRLQVAIEHHKATGDDSKIREVCSDVGCKAEA